MPRTLPTPSLPPLHLIPLTPTAFSPFGTAIQNPRTPTTSANQGTAQKYPQISPIATTYPATSPRATQNLNLFSCAPRAISSTGLFPITVLERHPFSSQTFIPLALSPEMDAGTFYVVIVAEGREVPDLRTLKAFRCRGDQAVTYAAGTWHAPMVVVGERWVDFCVVVGENGVAEEDCEEVLIEGEGVGLRIREGNWGLWEKGRSRL